MRGWFVINGIDHIAFTFAYGAGFAEGTPTVPTTCTHLHASAKKDCGSAGSYNLTEPEMAERLQRRKIENIIKSGAKLVITTNPGCILQIRAGLKKAGRGDIKVLHLVDYLST